MKIISHRGNLDGPNPKLENKPEHILIVSKRFEVEIDVWFIGNEWFLGHDEPQYKIDYTFFNEKMWLHCKNLQAVSELAESGLNWFWHEGDKVVLTSHNKLWCFPNIYLKNAITVELNFIKDLPPHILGVCTDYPEYYK